MGEQLMKGSFEDTSATNSIVDFLSSLAGAAAGDTDPGMANTSIFPFALL